MNGFNDIDYNFIFGESGIFEGRGWDVEVDTLIEGDRFVLGIFSSTNIFSEEVESLIKALIDDGKAIGKLSSTLEISCSNCIWPITRPPPILDVVCETEACAIESGNILALMNQDADPYDLEIPNISLPFT